MATKQTPNQVRRIEELQQFIRTVEHVKKLVTELEGNRAARPMIINNICGAIARDLSQMRQRAMTANVGTLADVAGTLAVVAARQGTGFNMKIRALSDGVNTMMIMLDSAMKSAHEPEKSNAEPQKPS